MFSIKAFFVSILLFHLIKSGDHVVVKLVVIPESDEGGEETQ